jgi:quinoprotein glucose dehydrogenase
MSKPRIAGSLTFLSLALLAATPSSRPQPIEGVVADWPYYGGDAGGSRYSRIAQINRSNVARLQVAWEYHTGDMSDGIDGRRKSAFETTPIVAHGTMYFTTPFNRVVALDPEPGKEKWAFDPKIDLRAPYSEGLINRGVALWSDPNKTGGEICGRRIFLATIDARLIALDAAGGRPCADFGANGQIDLTRGIPNITPARRI